MLRAYKTELDPNNAQRTAFLQHAGTARFVYNWALADRIERYKAGEKTNVYEQKRRFNALKDEQFPWIRNAAYVVTESAFANLDRAYQNFFRRVSQGAKEKGFPKFKSRHNGIGSFTMRGSIHVEAKRIKLPRIGWIRLKEAGYLPTSGVKILSASISEQAGRWFVSFQVEEDTKDIPPATRPAIGVDLGIKSLAVCSDGTVFENPLPMRNALRRLKRLSRELHRRQKGSKNREKTRRKLAKAHARIGNIRKDTIHKLTHHLTAKAKPSTLVIEDLNVSGMLRNHHLAGAIADSGLAEIRRQLTYKAQWYGVDLVIAGRFYPSSKTCSACGSVKPLLRLSERRFVCEACGTVIDRDLNAAINLMQLTTGKPSGSEACGEESFIASARCSSVNQEPGTAPSVNPGGNPNGF